MYDDFTFNARHCTELGVHAFWGESSAAGAKLVRNLYELPGGVQTETLLAYADALWTAQNVPGARYEIDEAGRLTDSQDNEDTGGTL